jgi:hypothetical protein
VSETLIALRTTSTITLGNEITGAFMPPVKCDADGNLFIRKFATNRPLGPVIKIDQEGKPTALFSPDRFPDLKLDRIIAFFPAADGGIYQVAQSSISKTRSAFVLHYSSDGSPSSPTRLDAEFEIYTFAAFSDGNFLISGTERDPLDKNDHGRPVTKVFSPDGSELAQLSFEEKKAKKKTGGAAPISNANATNAATPPQSQTSTNSSGAQPDGPPPPPRPGASETSVASFDLKDAEASRDGNLYVMRSSSQALVNLISSGGKITKTLKIPAPLPGAVPVSFHVSENRLALLFGDRDQKSVAIAVVDAQTGRRIALYSGSTDLGSFACYSANDGVFTFLKHGDKSTLEITRAEP